MSLFQLLEVREHGKCCEFRDGHDENPPGSGPDSQTQELSWMGQNNFVWGLVLRLCSSVLGTQEDVYSTNVLPGGIFVDVGEGPMQLIMGDYSY